MTMGILRVELDEAGVVAFIHGSLYENETPRKKWTNATSTHFSELPGKFQWAAIDLFAGTDSTCGY